MGLDKSKPPIDAARPSVTETATFASGWFWGPDSRFGSLQGVISTRVGYAGGDKLNPTYSSLGNHSETVKVEYDPSVISYRDLLDVFWYSHNPTTMPWSDQYKSIIFYHNDEQKALAEETWDNLQASLGKQIFTQIRPAGMFYPAEDYHQKYYLRGIPRLEAEFLVKYPDINDFVNSTAVARANGYAGGFGTLEDVQEELGLLGLSAEGQEIIRELAEQGLAPACPVSLTSWD